MWGRSKKSGFGAGNGAPSFRLQRLGGETESLEQILANGPALLAFYKVSCPVCQLTFPFLERMAASSSMQVIGISQDEDVATHGFNQRFGVTFPTLLDQSKEGYPASNAYGITSVPTLFLVEKNGKISKSVSGFSKRELEAI